MERKANIRSLLMFLLCISIIVYIAGCSTVHKDSTQMGDTQKAVEKTVGAPSVNNNVSTAQLPKIERDTSLTQKLKKESVVLDGQVYIQGDRANGCIIIKDGVKDQEAVRVAQKYAAELRKIYKGKKINVQAVSRDGKNLANIY
ncbi:MAG: hypothetical protein N3B21_10800 [Clostridia bacterium]|nr:hypothetical protein [Clostridia bacterium]